jgi:hypothetical protein
MDPVDLQVAVQQIVSDDGRAVTGLRQASRPRRVITTGRRERRYGSSL